MQVSLAILAMVWAIRDVVLVSDFQGYSLVVGMLWVVLWFGVAIGLWKGDRPSLFSGILVFLALLELTLMRQWPEYGLILLAWVGLTAVVTAGRPRETVLAVRVLVSSVYVFAALSKMQPSWIRGENMKYLLSSRPQAEAVLGFLPDVALVGIASCTVLVELWLGVGLWIRRTRLLTALLGVFLHLALIALATRGGLAGFLHLIVLNFGLVLLYASFWLPVPARPDIRCGHSLGSSRS